MKKELGDQLIRRARDLQKWYITNGSKIKTETRLIIDKLRAEYDKDRDELNKTQAGELDPMLTEYNDLIDNKVKPIQKKVSELGVEHENQHKDLSRKFLEMELKVLNLKL